MLFGLFIHHEFDRSRNTHHDDTRLPVPHLLLSQRKHSHHTKLTPIQSLDFYCPGLRLRDPGKSLHLLRRRGNEMEVPTSLWKRTTRFFLGKFSFFLNKKESAEVIYPWLPKVSSFLYFLAVSDLTGNKSENCRNTLLKPREAWKRLKSYTSDLLGDVFCPFVVMFFPFIDKEQRYSCASELVIREIH